MALVSKTFSQIITFTRASTATYFDATGTLQSAAIDAPRLDYDPATLAAQGLLIEESRTNGIRNNTMVGAVAGTPGTLPTNWNTAGVGTLVQEIVGTGTDAGITYVDYRLSGTTSTTAFALLFDATTQIVAASGQAWTSSYYIKLQNGSATNITGFSNQVRGYNGGVLQESNNGTITLTSSLARSTHTFTLANASTTRVINNLLITFASGVAIDITLRIGLPQLEQGAFATSVIPTTTTALTRSADVASVNTLSPWYSATEGTLYFEAQFYNAPNVAISNMGALSDGTNSNRVTVSSSTSFSGNINSNVSSGGVGQANPYVGSLSTVGPHKAAATYANNSFNIAVNGTLGIEDTSGIVPVSVNTLILGRAANGAGATNGWLRRATYYPRKLSSAELQTITA